MIRFSGFLTPFLHLSTALLAEPPPPPPPPFPGLAEAPDPPLLGSILSAVSGLMPTGPCQHQKPCDVSARPAAGQAEPPSCPQVHAAAQPTTSL